MTATRAIPRPSWPSSGLLLGTILAATSSLPGFAEAPQGTVLRPMDALTVDGRFIEEGKTRPAENLSGIACLRPRAGGSRECLVVNDENQAAQRTRLSGGVLAPGAAVPLIGPGLPVDARGSAPSIGCPAGQDDFEELDGEGVASVPNAEGRGGTYYVVGSHGCTRRGAKTRLSTFLLARIPVDGEGTLGAPELTWRLTGALRSDDSIGPFFGQALTTGNGLNIEGIAATREELLVGMRAPSVKGQTYIATVQIAALFAPGSSDYAGRTNVEPVLLGENAGIRDMTLLPDGRLLILSGPAQEQPEVDYRLWMLDIRTGANRTLTCLGHLEEVRANNVVVKAEAVAVLSVEDSSARVLILFDGVRNGGPREYRVNLQAKEACR
jgi:hypothetical protein